MDLPDRDESLDWTLVDRYFAGQCTSLERAIVERWVAQSPAHAAELEALKRWWAMAADVPAPGRVDAMWDGLARRMHAVQPTAAPARVTHASAPRRRHSFELEHRAAPAWRRWAVAAAACLVVGTGALLVTRGGVSHDLVTSNAPAMREFATTRGQRTTIGLADGSRVELGYNSRLRVASFEGGRRELYLDGEAVFDVVHDTTRRFLVHAANATTEDIGTVFGVRAYSGDSVVRVLVLAGSVALRPRDSTAAGRSDAAPLGTVLGRAQLGRLDARGRVEVESAVDTAAYLAWLHGRIAFRDAPLSEIVADLSRRFDVDIQLHPASLGARRLTLDVPGRSLQPVLDAIAVPLGLRHRKVGGAFVLERAP